MIDSEFQTIGLYGHNANSYRSIRGAYNSGEDIVGIVHATGTGKSYDALQLAYDNKDKKTIYVVPSNGIIEHIKKIIEDNPNLDMKRDFPNLEFRTYQSFISMSKEEIAAIPCDLLILDEFHHIGAPIWGARINTMIETHPNMKVFGMTAYTVRDRGTPYERDMANPDTDELFSRKIVSRYDICDAMIDGVLPKPVYKCAYVNLLGLANALEVKVQRMNATSKEYFEYMSIIRAAKKRIHEAPGIAEILRKNIKPDGKYIYFCPPCIEEGTNDIEIIKRQALEWFKQFVPEEDIIFYTSTSEMGVEGRLNRETFYNDVTLTGESVDNKLRVMFAINQYNEGIHAPNIDGVIMGRGTASDIVFFEQLGRALSVRGNTKEMFDKLEKYSVEQLLEMCKARDIRVMEDSSKEELIEKLIAPIIIDLADNYDFIKELENNLKDRIKDIQESELAGERAIKIRDASFDIEVENQDLFDMLKTVMDRLEMSWEDTYEYAQKYYEHHGNLLVPYHFRTSDGYTKDENGRVNLGIWIANQRGSTTPESEKGQALKKIGMVWNVFDSNWEEMYKYAQKYYEYYGNLIVPYNFKTNDGYTKDENGRINLGIWIANQRGHTVPESERGQALKKIGMVWNVFDSNWEEMYKYAQKYYEHHGNLLVLYNFKTNDGYTNDENGSINLGSWITHQRKATTPESERGQALKKIGMVWNTLDEQWNVMYEYAKKYYEHHGNLLVPKNFKTNDGYTMDENGSVALGKWISHRRGDISPESERGQALAKIGMVWNALNAQWNAMYEYAKKYYEQHGNLLVPQKFKTIDGYTKDENGTIKLGLWISYQRGRTAPESERGQALAKIGMVWNIKKNSEALKNLCTQNGIDIEKNKSVIDRISMQEMYAKIEFLKERNIPLVDEKGLLIDIFSMCSVDIERKYGITLEELITNYYISKQKSGGI